MRGVIGIGSSVIARINSLNDFTIRIVPGLRLDSDHRQTQRILIILRYSGRISRQIILIFNALERNRISILINNLSDLMVGRIRHQRDLTLCIGDFRNFVIHVIFVNRRFI
ncbi:hypothetical protein SDC9_136658 [bioreactor metagenome]|uniref:Uncharacterized protein n=1 Tax=bioreactor metagenome TaxID=1076179 RepID=A0A645DJR9_9ZZZZ